MNLAAIEEKLWQMRGGRDYTSDPLPIINFFRCVGCIWTNSKGGY